MQQIDQELSLDVIYAIHTQFIRTLSLYHSIIRLFYSHHNSRGHVTFLIHILELQAYLILIFHLDRDQWMTKTGLYSTNK